MINNLIRKLSLRPVKESLGVDGFLLAEVKRAGTDKFVPIWRKPTKNIITDVALAQIALLIWDDTADAFDYGAVGEGVGGADKGDEALGSEVDRTAIAGSNITTTETDDTVQAITEHTAPEGGWDITEYALVTAAVGGVIYNRVVFAAVHLDEDDVLKFTYQSQVKRSA